VGIQIRWDDLDPDILILDYRSNWTWDEYHAATHRATSMIRTVSSPAYVIGLGSEGFPISPNGILSQFNRVVPQLPPNLALIVVVPDCRRH